MTIENVDKKRANATDLSSSYGSLKGKLKMSGQQFKDMVRRGWD